MQVVTSQLEGLTSLIQQQQSQATLMAERQEAQQAALLTFANQMAAMQSPGAPEINNFLTSAPSDDAKPVAVVKPRRSTTTMKVGPPLPLEPKLAALIRSRITKSALDGSTPPPNLIELSKLNPDLNGDGHVTAEEAQIYQVGIQLGRGVGVGRLGVHVGVHLTAPRSVQERISYA